ncbi:MAG: hypothetical protein ACK5S5_13785 [Planctomycetota bacterium]|jgi:hypothetical protein
MHIDPVFLVPPRPRSAWTRRGFLFASATFVGGASVGSACGFAIASRRPELPQIAEPTATGDVELDQLRRLAARGTDAELVQHRLLLVASTFSHYSADPVLWHGIARLADLVVADVAFPDRAVFARALVGVVERADSAHADAARQRLADLRGVR